MARYGLIAFLDSVGQHVELTEWKRRQISRAYRYAKDAHRQQTRDDGERFFNHPKEVALRYVELCVLSGHIPQANGVVAALLHDVVEDRPDISIEDIQFQFNRTVAAYVHSLTNVPGESEKEFAERLENASITALIIKFADRSHNLDTLDWCAPEKRQQKLHETEVVILPLAHDYPPIEERLRERMAMVTVTA